MEVRVDAKSRLHLLHSTATCIQLRDTSALWIKDMGIPRLRYIHRRRKERLSTWTGVNHRIREARFVHELWAEVGSVDSKLCAKCFARDKKLLLPLMKRGEIWRRAAKNRKSAKRKRDFDYEFQWPIKSHSNWLASKTLIWKNIAAEIAFAGRNEGEDPSFKPTQFGAFAWVMTTKFCCWRLLVGCIRLDGVKARKRNIRISFRGSRKKNFCLLDIFPWMYPFWSLCPVSSDGRSSVRVDVFR